MTARSASNRTPIGGVFVGSTRESLGVATASAGARCVEIAIEQREAGRSGLRELARVRLGANDARDLVTLIDDARAALRGSR